VKYIDCILCGSKEKITLASQQFKDKYLELLNPEYNKTTRKWVKCQTCGFIYHNPILDKTDTKNLYLKFRDNSFRNENPDDYFNRIISLPKNESENYYKVAWLNKSLKNFLPPNFKVLDVGCGGGVFLYALRKEIPGCQIYGLEPTKAFADLAAHNLSCEVFAGNFEGFIFDGEYDLIICNHVLEHVDDPITFFKNLYVNLKKSGHLYIEVPSIVDFDDKSLPSDHDRFLMQHMWYYSPEILNKIAIDIGFQTIKMETQKTVIGKNNLVAIFQVNKK
jgi:2-polyprenyl-3-methyl-5-hydroxy-6-metoxy-1,4-benzoquinol methylase